jgi:hypothetical protein
MADRTMSKDDMKRVETTIEKSVNYFNGKFREIRSAALKTDGVDRNSIKNREIAFSYLVDEIQRGPYFNVPKAINVCEDWLKAFEGSLAQ